jgi:hypothetical protein
MDMTKSLEMFAVYALSEAGWNIFGRLRIVYV